MNRGIVVAIGTCAAVMFAAVASALPDVVGGAADASLPASRGTMVQETPTLPPPVPRVLWVGDSSLEGIKFYSHALDAIGGMTYVLDAESCRRLVRPSCLSLAGNTPNTALEAIQGRPDRSTLSSSAPATTRAATSSPRTSTPSSGLLGPRAR